MKKPVQQVKQFCKIDKDAFVKVSVLSCDECGFTNVLSEDDALKIMRDDEPVCLLCGTTMGYHLKNQKVPKCVYRDPAKYAMRIGLTRIYWKASSY